MKKIKPILIMGFCLKGPYRYAKDILENPDIKWINWGYSTEYIHPEVIDQVRNKIIKSGTEVMFAIWKLKEEKKAKLIRKGIIDHIIFKKEYINFTVFLKETVLGFVEFSEVDQYLCRYIDLGG
ncbi:MAG: hypothetical protein DRI61_15490 [Chloroflexi bacterium]|nr:MAG: hypothetical protein DRI61_15490 [Chloroflexota bacterium]